MFCVSCPPSLTYRTDISPSSLGISAYRFRCRQAGICARWHPTGTLRSTQCSSGEFIAIPVPYVAVAVAVAFSVPVVSALAVAVAVHIATQGHCRISFLRPLVSRNRTNSRLTSAPITASCTRTRYVVFDLQLSMYTVLTAIAAGTLSGHGGGRVREADLAPQQGHLRGP